MPTKWKKISLGLFSGLFLLHYMMGMSLFFTPEAFIMDKTIQESLRASSAEHNQVRVIKENAVLRIKPKEGTVVIKKLPLGALLDVKEEVGDWLKIALPPDEDGFILTGYLHRSFAEEASLIHE
jgi:hypothetical protein